MFVIGFKMSVAGVALATIISQAVSAALVTRSLMLMDGPTQLHLDRLAIKPHIMRMIIQIGLPAGIQSCMFSLSNVVIQSSVNSFGSIVIAGNAAGANVGNFVYQAMNTFQQAVTCFAGQNIGARKPRRVLTSMYVSLFWALSFGVVFGVLSCVFGTQLLGLYSPDPAVIQVGLNHVTIVCGPYFLCGIMDVMTGVLRGVGYSLLPMIVSLMGACVFRIFWVMTIFAAQPHDGLPAMILPRFVDADLPRAGGDLRGALEKENPAALYAGGIGGAIEQQNRPIVILRSVFYYFSADRRKNTTGCTSSPLGAVKCVPSFLKGFDRFDKPES